MKYSMKMLRVRWKLINYRHLWWQSIRSYQSRPTAASFIGERDMSKDPRTLLPIDLAYPARHYPRARRMKRQVHLHIGPTNSGKSHTALLAFKAAKSGYYAGPLRMLAREIYDRMEAENIPCNLVTGDEILEKEGATLNSGTVEMIDLAHEMDVAVIDEIQMIEDPERGWAWTRAFLGTLAKHLHLCGDPSSEQIIKKLVKETGDVLTVHRYERLSPLNVAKQPLTLNRGRSTASLYKSVEPGDCIVCFSKKQVQLIRDKIVQAHGNRMCCAIIYGSLPPETRAEQARLFNNYGETKVEFLAASDAIGMGLNLGIKRVIFTSLRKFDGRALRDLEVSEIKQIAGRAGRFRTADGNKGDAGVVTCLKKSDISIIEKALSTPTPEIKQAVLMPPSQLIRSALIGIGIGQGQRAYFSRAMAEIFQESRTGAAYCKPRQGKSTDISQLFDRISNLTFEDRMVLANAPVPASMPLVQAAFTKMCKSISNGRSYNVLELFPELMSWLNTANAVGQTLETIHKTLTLFLWVSYRFPCTFADRKGALDLKRLCESHFDALLANSRGFLAAPSRALGAQSSAMSRNMVAEDACIPLKGPRKRQRVQKKNVYM